MFTSFPRFPAGGPRTDDDDSLILFGTNTISEPICDETDEGRSLAFWIYALHIWRPHFVLFYRRIILSYNKTLKARPMGYFARKSGGLLKGVIKVTGSFQGSNHDY